MSGNLIVCTTIRVPIYSIEGVLRKCRTDLTSIFFQLSSYRGTSNFFWLKFFCDPCAYILPEVNIGVGDVLVRVSR